MNRTIIIEWLTSENREDLDKIVKQIDEIVKEDIVNVYIYSTWWDSWMFNILIDKLNKLVDLEYDITMTWILMFSNWFNIFNKFKWKRLLDKNAEALLHTWALSYPVFTHNTLKVRWDEIDKQRAKNTKPNEYPFLTKKEQNKLNNWNDIYLWYDRLKEIFN